MKHYCNPTLPLVFDDSLSYYECLCKVQYSVNSIWEIINGNIDDVIASYINNHINDLLLDASYNADNKSIILKNAESSNNPTSGGDFTNVVILNKSYNCTDMYLNNHTKHVLNILKYGAVADNTTDNSDVFISAIKYCINNKMALYIPSGDYYLARTIAVDGNAELEIFGDGSTSVLHCSAETGIFFKHHSIINAHDFAVTGEEENTVALEIYSKQSIFHNLFINCQGIGIRFCNHENTISNCVINQTSSANQKEKAAVVADTLDGDDGTNWSVNNKLIGNSITSNLACLAVLKTRNGHTQEGLICSDNTMLSTGVVAILVDTLFTGLFTNNIFDLATKFGVMLNPACSHVTFSNCYMNGGTFAFYSVHAHEVTVTHCVLFSTDGGGAFFSGTGSNAKNIVFTDNQIQVKDVCIWIDKVLNIYANGNMCQTSGITYLYYDDNSGECGILTGCNFKPASANMSGVYTEDSHTNTFVNMK